MTDAQKQTLLKLARDSITTRFDRQRMELPTDPEFQARRGLFVTLHSAGQLRGCIGLIEARKSIAEEVFSMAREAAFGDPRFPALRRDEWTKLRSKSQF